MFFCPRCRSLYTINKPAMTGGSVEDMVSRIAHGRPIRDRHVAGVTLESLKGHPEMARVSKAQKKEIETAISEHNQELEVQTEAVFLCDSCGYIEPIQPGTVVYSKDYGDMGEGEDLDYAVYDPAAGRTRTYLCPEPSCGTHQTPELREAVLVKDSFGVLVYICTVCQARWKPSF